MLPLHSIANIGADEISISTHWNEPRHCPVSLTRFRATF
jgi:hypothetical protein